MHWVQSGLVFECDDVEGARDEGEVVTYRNRVKDRVWFTTAIEQSGVKADDVVEAAAKLANSSPLPETEPMVFQRVRDFDPAKVAKVQIGDEVIPVEVECVKREGDKVTRYDFETGEEYEYALGPGQVEITASRVGEKRSHKAGEQSDSCPACAPLQQESQSLEE